MATKTVVDAGGVWTTDATWVEGTKPTASDDAVTTATSGALVISSTGVCRSADFTGYLAGVSGSSGLTIGTSTLPGSNVALKLVSGMSWTHTGTVVFASTTTGGTITFAGKTLGGASQYNGVGGGWTFQDAFSLVGTLTLVAGTLDLNGQTGDMFSLVASGTTTRSLTFGASTITMGGTTWNTSGTGLTLSAASSTINFNRAGTTTFTPAASQTWGTMNVVGATGFTIATTATTITNFAFTPTAAATLTLPAGVTTTITNTPSIYGSPGKLATIVSSSAGSAATLSVASGTVRFNHCSIKDLTCTGGATFLAYDSIDVSGNTGITFVPAKKCALAGVG